MSHDPEAVPDAALVAAVRCGDAAAADALVRRHWRAAWAVALAQLGDRDDAEDVVQDSFMRALERIEDCRKPDRFVYWLLQIVRNHAHNARDRRRVRSGPSVEDVNAAAPGDAARDAERNDLGDRLLAALAGLPEVQREVVLLKDLEEWDHRRIATHLGISEDMSRQHASQARKHLRATLGSRAREEHFDER